MTQRLFTACGLAVLLAASPASAQGMPPPADDMGPPPGDMPPPRRPRPPLTRAVAEEMIARGFAMLDANHDGTVTRDEYAAFRDARREEMMARHGAEAPRDPAMRGPGPMMSGPHWFEMADANGDGRVTLAEARAGAMALFDRMDTDHDGVVSADERRAAMAAMRPHGPPPKRDDTPPR